MSFELHHRKHIEDDLTKIVRQQLRNTADALTKSEGSQVRSAVHESRKSVKKVRAVVAFLTEAGAKLPRRDRKRLKSAARALSRVRDTTAIIDTFDRVRRRYPKVTRSHLRNSSPGLGCSPRSKRRARTARRRPRRRSRALGKNAGVGKKVVISFNQALCHDRDRRRLLSSES